MSNLAYDSYVARNGEGLTLDLAGAYTYALPSGGYHDDSLESSGDRPEDLEADLSSAAM